MAGTNRKTKNEEPQAVFCRAKDLDQSSSEQGWAGFRDLDYD